MREEFCPTIRKCIEDITGVKACNIELKGVLPIDFKIGGTSTSGNCYESVNTVRCWGFTPATGFVPIKSIVTEYQSESNANGTWENEYGYTAEYLYEQMPDSMLWVIKSYHYYSDCNGQHEEETVVSVYKANDFKSHLEKLKMEDTKRWEEWINN